MTISTASLRAQLADCLHSTKATPSAIASIMRRMTTLTSIARFAEALLAAPSMSEGEMLSLAASL